MSKNKVTTNSRSAKAIGKEIPTSATQVNQGEVPPSPMTP